MSEQIHDVDAARSGLDALHDIATDETEVALLFDYHFGAELNHVFALLFHHAPDFAAELGDLTRGLPRQYGLQREDLSSEVRDRISVWRAAYLKHPYRDDPRLQKAIHHAS